MKKVVRKKKPKKRRLRNYEDMKKRGWFSGGPKLATATGRVDGVPVSGRRA